jgi:hypothetical protein
MVSCGGVHQVHDNPFGTLDVGATGFVNLPVVSGGDQGLGTPHIGFADRPSCVLRVDSAILVVGHDVLQVGGKR